VHGAGSLMAVHPPAEYPPRAAKAGHGAAELCCPCCATPVLVAGYATRRYRCRFCDTPCEPTGRGATLGPKGVLPDQWWEGDDPDELVAIARLSVVFGGTVLAGLPGGRAMTDPDPRQERLAAATAELAGVDADIWRLAAAARVLLGASGDPDAQRVAAKIQAAEDMRACARADIYELAAELGLDD
jgi:hypothetical protein